MCVLISTGGAEFPGSRKVVSFALVIAGVAMGLVVPPATQAQVGVRDHSLVEAKPVPTDGMIADSGVYLLSHDISTDRSAGITIAADDVVVDLGGHALRYAAPPKQGTYGIVVNRHANITLKNGKLGGFWFGIHCTQNQRLRIEDIAFDDIPYLAVNIAKSSRVHVAHNRFTNFRFDLPKARDKYVIGINCGAEDLVISDNDFQSRSPDDLQNNDIELVFVLLSARVSRRCTVALNHMKADRCLPRSYGVWIASEAQATIANNDVTNMAYGVCLAADAAAVISHNRMGVKDTPEAARSFPSYGVHAHAPRKLVVTSNVFEGVSEPALMPASFVFEDNLRK